MIGPDVVTLTPLKSDLKVAFLTLSFAASAALATMSSVNLAVKLQKTSSEYTPLFSTGINFE